MEANNLQIHFTKWFEKLEHRIANRVVQALKDDINSSNETSNDKLLKDTELCELLQISTSHFYKLKKKHKKFPTHEVGGAKRYRLSEVETFLKTLKK